MKEILDGDAIQNSEAFKQLSKPLIDLVARTAIWVKPANVTENPVYPDKRRGKPEDKGKVIDGIKIDDNTYANKALKRAISKNIDFINYHTCHIWPGTTYDERYHTQLANLVLIPKVLANLSDYCPLIIDILKYRSWELYKWHPKEENDPKRPEYYPEEWRNFIDDTQHLSADEPMDLEEYLYRSDNEGQSNDDDLEEYNNNREEIEIEKVRRKVPGWLRKPNQICSIILSQFMQLSKNGQLPVKKDDLKAACEKDGVEKFDGNYIQMKNFGIKNHAKVFQEENDHVYLWVPISTFVKGLYNNKK